MNRLLLLLSLAGLLVAAGCRKDDVIDCKPTPTPPTQPPTQPPTLPTSNISLEEFTRRHGVPVQTFRLILGPTAPAQTFTTTSGAKITFPGASFLLPNGAAATDTAQVRIREIYSVPDMVFSNMPTQLGGNRRVLISGGEFSIQVWLRGTRLRLAAGLPRVVVQAPATAGSGLGLLPQQLLWQQPATRLVGDSAGWVRPGSRADTVRTNAGPGGAYTYSVPIPLDSVSWWNIDRLWHLYQTAPLGTVTVQTPAIPATSVGSTYVFVRLVGYNGLARLFPTSATKTDWAGQLPTGANLVVAILQSINGQLYFGTQAFTTQNGLVIKPTLTAVSEADAVTLIKQL